MNDPKRGTTLSGFSERGVVSGCVFERVFRTSTSPAGHEVAKRTKCATRARALLFLAAPAGYPSGKCMPWGC